MTFKLNWTNSKPSSYAWPRGAWTAYPVSDRVELRTCLDGTSICIKVTDRRYCKYTTKRMKKRGETWNHPEDALIIQFGANGKFMATIEDFKNISAAIDEAKRFLVNAYAEKSV
jgi:hypothetical protein